MSGTLENVTVGSQVADIFLSRSLAFDAALTSESRHPSYHHLQLLLQGASKPVTCRPNSESFVLYDNDIDLLRGRREDAVKAISPSVVCKSKMIFGLPFEAYEVDSVLLVSGLRSK